MILSENKSALKTNSPEAVANGFLEIAASRKSSLTNMQLQKLVYIAHGFHLAFFDKPLIKDGVEAWQYGPVYPTLYQKLKKYGAGNVTEYIESDDKLRLDNEARGLLSSLWQTYGQMTGFRLSAITHAEGTPWSQVWHQSPYSIIPDELIQSHYQEKLAAADFEN